MKRSPIKPRRDKPRRKAPERTVHTRIKPRPGADMTAEERRHVSFVRSQPCLVPGCICPATAHHVTGYADRPGRFARSHWLVVPLCAKHHQKVHDPLARDPISVEGLGHQGFFLKFGIDLLAEAERLAAISRNG